MSDTMDLAYLTSIVASNPSLQAIRIDQVFLFFTIVSLMKDDLLLLQPPERSPDVPPILLPPSAERFMASACKIPLVAVQACWTVFKGVLWKTRSPSCIGDSILRAQPMVFEGHGLPSGFTFHTFYPPTQFCSTPTCQRTLKNLRMIRAEQRWCVLYTLADGAIPVYAVHLMCEACGINYHHNFTVRNGQRVYYGGVPDVLQVGEHQFVEKHVIEMWMSLMDTWVSASSCANIYNRSLSRSKVPPPGWPIGFTVSSDHVWDAFVLHSLLEDASECEELLVVSHTGAQHSRFTELVQARNQHMRIEGQPEISHFCNRCTWWYYGPDGQGESALNPFHLPLMEMYVPQLIERPWQSLPMGYVSVILVAVSTIARSHSVRVKRLCVKGRKGKM
ncbi:hypothetical protein JVU11DRAFT_1951 [Chiua virens]|nr:hypothetical protein JVU11DRAFT_1951 [Chiua virens]